MREHDCAAAILVWKNKDIIISLIQSRSCIRKNEIGLEPSRCMKKTRLVSYRAVGI